MSTGGLPGALRTLLSAASDEWRATPFYRMMLSGADPAGVLNWPINARLGKEERGREILKGEWRFGSERLASRRPNPFSATPPSEHFAARLHGFGWLGDLDACGLDARNAIIGLITAWTDGYGAWHAESWAPEITANRLFSWLCHGRYAFESNELTARPAILRSLGRQARHLQLAVGDVLDPMARIKVGAALSLAGAAGLPEADRLLDLGLETLMECCASQFLADGGHMTRAPELLAEAHYDCLTVSMALTVAKLEVPRLITDMLSRSADMLRLLRLTDGKLACFNGGGEGDRLSLEAALLRTPSARPFRFASQSGFHRLESGPVSVVLDAGAAPLSGYGERAHAGALAFEFSDGPDRVVVNVGSSLELHPEWRAASRPTNAHSTLIVDDALSCRFEAGRLGRPGARPIGPPGLSARRTEDEEGAWVEASHEGYRNEFGFVHRRTVFLDQAGKDLRGQDALVRPLADGRSNKPDAIPFAVRFHLHPSVTVERGPSGALAVRTAQSGQLWRLRTDATEVELESSIYLADAGGPQKARQIVLKALADPNGAGDCAPNRIRWAFTRFERA